MFNLRTTLVRAGVLHASTLLAACSTASVSPSAMPIEADAATEAVALPDGGSEAGPKAIALGGCGVGPTVKVTLGGTQSFTMLIDTGSATTGVASASCDGCKQAGLAPLYRPEAGAMDRHRTASATYASVPPVGWSGEVYGETLAMKASEVPGARVDLVSIDAETGFFDNEYCGENAYQGILGLGRSAVALPGTSGYLDDLAHAGSPDVFAFRLCPSGGQMWLGGFDSKLTPAYTPMTSDKSFYTVILSDLKIDETSLGLPPTAYGRAFVDTGGSALWLPHDAFGAATGAIGKSAKFAELFGAAASFFRVDNDLCTPVTASKAELDAALPPLTLVFGSGGADGAVSVPSPATESYLHAVDDGFGTVCYRPALFEMSGRGKLPPVELGASILQGKLVVVDRANARIGFASAPCP